MEIGATVPSVAEGIVAGSAGQVRATAVDVPLVPFALERIAAAVEKVYRRLLRASGALEAACVPYAVAGDNAVAAWVARVDEAAVRKTRDVDILLRRSDLDSATGPLESAGFVRRHAKGTEMFLDGDGARARDAVHVVFAGERVRPGYSQPAPDVTESEPAGKYRILTLPALVRMKLISFRIKDWVHLLDLLGVGLIDAAWVATLPADLAARLREILDNPDA